MKKKIQVECPQCNKKFSYYSSEFRPFCSNQCKLIDLGQWLDEAYSVKGKDNSVYLEDPESLKDLNEDY